MFLTQEAKDPSNVKNRKASLLEALQQKRLLTLVVEPSSVCDLSCRFCDLHSGRYRDVKQYKGKMTLAVWKMLMSQIGVLGYKLEQLQIHGNGEPLLNKDIVKMVACAKPIAKKIRLTTNGVKLTPTMTRKLVEAGVDEIWISLDIADDLLYNEFKGKDKYDTVRHNICMAVAFMEMQSENASLIIKYPISDSNKTYGVNQYFGESVVKEFGWFTANSQKVHLKGMPVVAMTGGKTTYESPCEIPFYSLFVKFDGRVSLCCADFRDDLTMGNIYMDSLKEIIDGPFLRLMRLRHLDGKFKNIPLCRTCGNRTCVDLTDIKDEVRKLI